MLSDKGKNGQRPVHNPHDKGYRQLLTNSKTFLELLQTFVKEGWVHEIKEDDLTLVNRSYILQDYSGKEADIVYRLRLRGDEVIFYILLELQSTVDHTMPFRLLQYMVEIWRDICKNTPKKEQRRKEFRLPAIIPAVLYNGAGGWTACKSFREYQTGQERLTAGLLDFTYILFDIVRYSEEDLQQASNVISSVFYLEQAPGALELTSRLKKLAEVLEGMTPEQFRQIAAWLNNVIRRKTPPPYQEEISGILQEKDPREVKKVISNVERILEEMQRQALLEGIQEGKEEGKREGRREGKREGIQEVARALLSDGMKYEKVKKLTGLTDAELKEIKH
jgi:predicted transposase/invertase (TIGR01784 family)